MSKNQSYVALLRGINVGGHHKVPMAELREEMEKLGFENVKTLLNSGNIIFDGPARKEAILETQLATHLEKQFGFQIPVLIRMASEIIQLIKSDPFANIKVTKDIRLYVSFLKERPDRKLELPWESEDKSYQIIAISDRAIISILDLSKTSTPKGMDVLEQLFGKDITTRNWNTINKIAGKLK